MFTVREVATGKIVKPGDKVTNFRGEVRVLRRAVCAASEYRSGRVKVEGSPIAYYDKVFGLRVTDQAEGAE